MRVGHVRFGLARAQAYVKGLKAEVKAQQAEIRTWRKGYAAKSKVAKKLEAEVASSNEEASRLRALLQESRRERNELASRLQKPQSAAPLCPAVKVEAFSPTDQSKVEQHVQLQWGCLQQQHASGHLQSHQQQTRLPETLAHHDLDSQCTWDPAAARSPTVAASAPTEPACAQVQHLLGGPEVCSTNLSISV